MNTASDQSTPLAQLREIVRQFVAERDWQQFHSPKNLSMALAIEGAELMEHFQWLSTEASRALKDDAERREAVGEELADVLCYVLALANELELDLTTTLLRKMEKNVRTYPVDEFRGRYGRSDPGPAGS
jgi:dCTP diphosphatase